ncbi:MAG: enoyl-CoA hydratase/isomerase family protein [Chloroflexi bacterium]|nr:enoyl-CoA hydratase/isomerase family protein [Chloroflexota bacterium]
MESIIYEKKDHVAYITFNRPEVHNALDNPAKRRMGEIWNDFKNDPDIWLGVVTGAGGKAFSTGSDIKEILADVRAESRTERANLVVVEPLMEGKIEVYKPLIAAIAGWCIGGGMELALVCDIRIATQDAKFGLMEPKIGTIAESGGTIRLPNQIPYAVAMEMILTGDPITAQRAYEVGLINQVVPAFADLMPAARKMAERVLACAPLSVRVSKEQAWKSFNLPYAVGMSMNEIGREVIYGSNDFKEGFEAFVKKRPPRWTGK